MASSQIFVTPTTHIASCIVYSKTGRFTSFGTYRAPFARPWQYFFSTLFHSALPARLRTVPGHTPKCSTRKAPTALDSRQTPFGPPIHHQIDLSSQVGSQNELIPVSTQCLSQGKLPFRLVTPIMTILNDPGGRRE